MTGFYDCPLIGLWRGPPVFAQQEQCPGRLAAPSVLEGCSAVRDIRSRWATICSLRSRWILCCSCKVWPLLSSITGLENCSPADARIKLQRCCKCMPLAESSSSGPARSSCWLHSHGHESPQL